MVLIPRILELLDTDPLIPTAEFKLFAKVQESADDALCAKIVEAATVACEKWVGLYFRRKKVEWGYAAPAYRYGYPCKVTHLPYGPNQVIESVTRVDRDNVETVLTSDQYTVEGYSILGITTERRSRLSEYGQSVGYIKVVYAAGYHTDANPALNNPPEEDILEAVRRLATEMYENRQVSVTGTIVATLDVTHKTLLSPYRLNKLF